MCSPDMPETPDPPQARITPRLRISDIAGPQNVRQDPRNKSGFRGLISSAVGVLSPNSTAPKMLGGT